MRTPQRTASLLAGIALLLLLSGCDSCGFDCDNDEDNNEPASLTLSVSDTQPENLQEVSIAIDAIRLRRNNGAAVDIETFTLTQNGTDLVDEPRIDIDLLKYPGIASQIVVTDLAVEADFYDEIFVEIITGTIESSYVLDDNGEQHILEVEGGRLTLPGRQIDSNNQDITIEFGLARALEFNADTSTYLLTENGTRLVDDQKDPSLGGTIDDTLFNNASACEEKSTPTTGNRIYLYEGIALGEDALADVFNNDSATNPANNKQAPYAIATMAQSPISSIWEYSFGYLPAGDYTIAFSCNAGDDDARDYDDITIPLPDGQESQRRQRYEVSLTTGETRVCNLTEDASC